MFLYDFILYFFSLWNHLNYLSLSFLESNVFFTFYPKKFHYVFCWVFKKSFYNFFFFYIQCQIASHKMNYKNAFIFSGWLYWKAGQQTTLTPSPTFMCWLATKIPIRSCLLLCLQCLLHLTHLSTNVTIIVRRACYRQRTHHKTISSQFFTGW